MLCPCRVPSVDRCPRCPSTGYQHCVDLSTAEEKQKGFCVGLGACLAGFEGKGKEEGAQVTEDGREVGVRAIDWVSFLVWLGVVAIRSRHG
jgi:hypothetical protein